eukprot:89928_1
MSFRIVCADRPGFHTNLRRAKVIDSCGDVGERELERTMQISGKRFQRSEYQFYSLVQQVDASGTFAWDDLPSALCGAVLRFLTLHELARSRAVSSALRDMVPLPVRALTHIEISVTAYSGAVLMDLAVSGCLRTLKVLNLAGAIPVEYFTSHLAVSGRGSRSPGLVS